MDSFKRAILNNDLNSARKELDYLYRNFSLNDLEKFGNELPLHYAVMTTNVPLTKLLLDYEADPNIPTVCGTLIFHYSFVLKNVDLLDRFLARGANIHAVNAKGRTMLHFAVIYSSPEIVEKLLKMNADVNASDIFKSTPLHLSFNRAYLVRILPILRILVSYGTDINLVSEIHGSPLACAVRKRSVELTKCLVSLGADIDSVKDELLKIAVVGRHQDLVEYLLRRGADLCQLGDGTRSLLHLAFHGHAKYGFKREVGDKMVKFLMEKGLKVKKIDSVNFTDVDLQELEGMQQELDTLKATKVCKDYHLTYYDILTKRGNALVGCMRNETIRRVMASRAHIKMFPYFYNRLTENYIFGLTRYKDLEKMYARLQPVFESILPNEIISRIVEFFDDEYFDLDEISKYVPMSRMQLSG